MHGKTHVFTVDLKTRPVRSRRAVFLFKSSRWAPQPHHQYDSMYTAVQQQYRSSCTTAAVLQALAFVPVALYVWLVRSNRRRSNHDDGIPSSNATIMRHISSDIVLGKHSIQQQQKKTVARTYHWNACVSPFRLATPQGYQASPIPKGNFVSYQGVYIWSVQRFFPMFSRHQDALCSRGGWL